MFSFSYHVSNLTKYNSQGMPSLNSKQSDVDKYVIYVHVAKSIQVT